MKVFGKYDMEGVEIRDPSLRTVISLENPRVHSFGRHSKKPLGKMNINVVERLVNKLMRGGTGEKTSGKVIRTRGRLQGKKLRVLKSVEQAFDIIEKRTKKNPVQVLVDALENLVNWYSFKTIVSDSGAILNGVLIQNRLVDELSLLIAPVLAGKDNPTLFKNVNRLYKLNLKDSKVFDDGLMWVLYDIEYD